MNSKFKRVIYLGTTLLFYLTIFSGITYVSWFLDLGLNPNLGIIGESCARIVFELVILAVSFFVLALLDNLICESLVSENLYSIVMGIEQIFTKNKVKYAYHAELGEFLVVVSKSRITIFKQGYLSMLEIAEFNNSNNPTSITKQIKTELDNHYSNKLTKIREKQNQKNNLGALDEWDGYFDDQTRRDKKIENLLK